jgi:hypothetical protein
MESQQKTVVPWRTPFTAGVYGPSNSGKSVYVSKLLKHSAYIFEEDYEGCLYCYSVSQPLFEEMNQQIPNIEFHEGLPSLEKIKDFTRNKKHSLLILDDLQGPLNSSDLTESLFTAYRHHLRCSIIYICHNLYRQGKHQRTMTINTQLFTFFESVLNNGSLIHLAKQIFPKNPNTLLDAYQSAVSEKWGYLIVDAHPDNCHKETRLRTHIFPGEDTILYVKKVS